MSFKGIFAAAFCFCQAFPSMASAGEIYDKIFGGDALNGQPIVNSEFIQKLTQSGTIDSVEDLLKALPVHYRSGFVLIHDSESLQQADYVNPRVLLVGKEDFLGDPELKKHEAILSFNGHPSQIGYESIEMLQYQSESRKFELSEITFANGQARLSQTNPAKCLSCHARGGNEPYPIFHNYARWPGAYGADDGHIKIGSPEDRSLRQFIADRAAHPRYKYLVGLNDVDYTLDKKNYLLKSAGLQVSDDFARKDGYWISPYTGGGFDVLSQRLSEDNSNRIIRQIESSGKLEDNKELLSCLPVYLAGGYTWEKLLKTPEFSAPRNYFEAARAATNQQFWSVYQRTKSSTEFLSQELPPIQSDLDVQDKDRVTPVTAILSWIAQTSLGLDPTKWSIRPHSNDLSMTQPHDTSGFLAIARKFSSPQEPTLEECVQRFKRKAEATPQVSTIRYGENWDDTIFPTNAPIHVPQVALLCASCHAGARDHNFPFSDPIKMKKALTRDLLNEIRYRISRRAQDSGEGMPYLQPALTEENQKVLLNYLESVQSLKN